MEKPLLTKGCTSMIGFLLGDVMAQLLIEKVAYNWYRTFRLATFGLLVHGTTGHWFYGKLDNAIPGKGGGAVASKVFIDQVLWNPIFGIMFFGYMGLMQNMGIMGTIAEIKSKLLSQVTGSWTVWPIKQDCINFRFIPTDVRILYINTIQIFYNCFLSILSRPSWSGSAAAGPGVVGPGGAYKRTYKRGARAARAGAAPQVTRYIHASLRLRPCVKRCLTEGSRSPRKGGGASFARRPHSVSGARRTGASWEDVSRDLRRCARARARAPQLW